MDPILELEKMQAGGIRFSVHHVRDGEILIRLGDYRFDPMATAVVRTFDEAAAWLREQAKARFPESAYARRLLTN